MSGPRVSTYASGDGGEKRDGSTRETGWKSGKTAGGELQIESSRVQKRQIVPQGNWVGWMGGWFVRRGLVGGELEEIGTLRLLRVPRCH
jgi:hypothetical protein